MTKVKRAVLLSIAVLAIGLGNSSCDSSGDVTTTPQPTPIPLGDDTVTETVDDIRKAAEASDLFSDLWEAGKLDD